MYGIFQYSWLTYSARYLLQLADLPSDMLTHLDLSEAHLQRLP